MTLDELTNSLLDRDPLPPLAPRGIWKDDLISEIKSVEAPPLVEAGLHLWNDDIDRCHRISQAHATPEGNYWHAILHRRELDYSNSKYWYRHVGEHPIFPTLRESYPEWEPFIFVDWCQDVARGKRRKPRNWLEMVQAKELELLLKFVIKGHVPGSASRETGR